MERRKGRKRGNREREGKRVRKRGTERRLENGRDKRKRGRTNERE